MKKQVLIGPDADCLVQGPGSGPGPDNLILRCSMCAIKHVKVNTVSLWRTDMGSNRTWICG